MLTRRHHSRSSADRGSGPDPSFMTDVRVWTAWCLGCHTCPDVRSSCLRSHHNKLRREPSQWSLCLPDQQMTAQQVTAWQVTTWQVTAQQMTAQHMTGRQVTGPADSSALADPAVVTGPTDCVRLSSCCWPSTVSGGSNSAHPSLPVFSCCAVTPCWRTSGSSLRSFPPRGRHRSRVHVFWIQSPMSFRTPWEPSDRWTGWLGHQSRSPRDTVIPSPAGKRYHLRRLRQGHQSSIVWDLLLPPRPREQWHRSRPFALALAGESAADPIRTVWQVFCGFLNQTTLTGPRWGPGRLCPTLAESAGQLPGHRHCRGWGGQCIPATTSAHPSVRQLSDQKQPSGPPASPRCLAAERIHRAGHQHDFPRVLQPVVPGPKEDRRSAACNPLSTATW